MLKVIDRYVLRECIWSTSAVVAVLLVILLGNSLVRVLGDIVKGKLLAEALWLMLLVNLVHYLVVLIPMGLYLGILLAMGRLYRDSEMSAMSACGIGTRRLYRPILTLTVPLSLLTLVLSMYLAPWTAGKQDEILHQAKYASNLTAFEPGQFNTSGTQALFFERWGESNQQLQQVFVHATEQSTVQKSQRAVIRPEAGSTYIVFNEGKAYAGEPGSLNYRIIDYENYGVRIKDETPPSMNLRTSATPSAELWGATSPKLQAEWHWRLAVPLVCLTLGLLALPLSYSAPRKGRYHKIAIAVLLYIIYFNALGLGRTWLEREMVSELIGLWWAHLAVIIGTLLLLKKQDSTVTFANRKNTS